jgi:hypothetical protein
VAEAGFCPVTQPIARHHMGLKFLSIDRLTLILNPHKAVKNQLLLAHKKFDRESMQVKLRQDLLVHKSETISSFKT